MATGEPRNGRDVIYDVVSGAFAGAIAATLMSPLDVIKTKMQVLGRPDVKGSVIVTSLQAIIRNDGPRGLRCGLSPTLAALLPNRAVYFTVYGQLKELLESHVGDNGHLTLGANVVAASVAGAKGGSTATAITTNPMWVVKTRLQTQKERVGVVQYTSISSAFRHIIRKEGFIGLYSGLLPSLAGTTHVAIQFPAYEKIKCYLAERDHKTTKDLSPGQLAIASSASKILASLPTYPHEVIRSILQEQGHVTNSETRYTGVIDCVKKIYAKEGLWGFYRGCGTNLLRTTPSAVITFTSYEMINRFLHHVHPPHNNIPFKPDDGIMKPNRV
ncbi:nicotinamide adenine dinucleotide transporter 2, mitochondrial-like [Bidens hawaiensis]|uniref:nicotinamide adenine dinucleotide transporter 2, mitochondrial-like n=1 Tax=Bidens hawaiensis TaxID=980011 RepID=UPI00404ACC27